MPDENIGVVVNLLSVVVHMPKADYDRMVEEGRTTELNAEILQMLAQRDREGTPLAESLEEV